MTDTTTNFAPIPTLQQIAAIIRERGADTFDSPANAAYYIDYAIKEIERLHRDYSCICNEMRRMKDERDEARREILESLHPGLRDSYAAAREWDCFKENTDER